GCGWGRAGRLGARACSRLPHRRRPLSFGLRVVHASTRPADGVHGDVLVNVADWIVLLGTLVGTAAYGAWRPRHIRSLNTYLRGSTSTGWGTIGLSVMATQASAITFLSIPGQGFATGIV